MSHELGLPKLLSLELNSKDPSRADGVTYPGGIIQDIQIQDKNNSLDLTLSPSFHLEGGRLGQCGRNHRGIGDQQT